MGRRKKAFNNLLTSHLQRIEISQNHSSRINLRIISSFLPSHHVDILVHLPRSNFHDRKSPLVHRLGRLTMQEQKKPNSNALKLHAMLVFPRCKKKKKKEQKRECKKKSLQLNNLPSLLPRLQHAIPPRHNLVDRALGIRLAHKQVSLDFRGRK